MVRVSLYYRQGRPEGFVVQGHAGYGSHGADIVCAAVSVLAQTGIAALERLVGIRPQSRIEPGYLECFLPANLLPAREREALIILETVALGLQEIERAYSDFVSIEEIGISQA